MEPTGINMEGSAVAAQADGHAGRHILFVISSLSSGGAERNVAMMANHWAERGHRVSIVTWVDNSLLRPFYRLDPRVTVTGLRIATPSRYAHQRVWQTARRIRILRGAIEGLRPDVVISFMSETNVTTLLATRRLSVPVIVCERTDPAACPSIGRVRERLRRRLYPRAQAVVVQTARAAAYFADMPAGRLHVLPNPVPAPPQAAPGGDLEIPRPSLMALGRLGPEKGFDMLIEVFARLRGRHPEWSLVIVGEGSLRPSLEALRDRLGLTRNVLLPGRVSDPFMVLRQAGIFVLSSRFEGFPNALCEAMAAGLPVVSMDCPSGPREIVRHGVDGVLVPEGDAEGLYRALDSLMADPGERARLAARAPEVLERFSMERVMAMWDSLIASVVEKPDTGPPDGRAPAGTGAAIQGEHQPGRR